MRENETSIDRFDIWDVDDDEIPEDNTSANETYYSDESASRSYHSSEASRSQRQNSPNRSYSTRERDDASFDSRNTGSTSEHTHDSRSHNLNDVPDRSENSYSSHGSYRSRSFSHSGSRSDSQSYTSQGSETYYSEEDNRRSPGSDSRGSRSYSSRGRNSHYSRESSRRSSMDSRGTHRSSYSREGSQSLREKLSERSWNEEEDDRTSRGSYSSNSRSRNTCSRSNSQRQQQQHGGGGGGGNDDASQASRSSAQSQSRSRRSPRGESSTTARSAQSPGSHHSSAFQSSYASQISRVESLFLESANLFNEPLVEEEEEELEQEPTPTSTNSAPSSQQHQQKQQQDDQSMEKDSAFSMNEQDFSRNDDIFEEVSKSVENPPDSTFGMFEEEDFGSSTPNVFGGGGFEAFGDTDDDNNAWVSTTFHQTSHESSSFKPDALQQSNNNNNFAEDDNPLFGMESHQLPVEESKRLTQEEDRQAVVPSSSSDPFQQSSNQFGNDDDDQHDFAWGSTTSGHLGGSRASQTQHSVLYESSDLEAFQQSDSKFGGDTSQELVWGSTTSADLGGAKTSPTGRRRSAASTLSITSPNGSHRSATSTLASREVLQKSSNKFGADSNEFGWGSTTSDGFGESTVSHSRQSPPGNASLRETFQSPNKIGGDGSHKSAWGSTTSSSLGGSRGSSSRRKGADTRSSPNVSNSETFGGDDSQGFVSESSTLPVGRLEGSRTSQGEGRTSFFSSSSPGSVHLSKKVGGEDGKDLDWESTASGRLEGSETSFGRQSRFKSFSPKLIEQSQKFETSKSSQDSGQGLTTLSLGGSSLLHHEDQSTVFKLPTDSLGELGKSAMFADNSHQAGRSRSGLGSIGDMSSHDAPSMKNKHDDLTKSIDGTQRSLSLPNRKQSQNTTNDEQLPRDEDSRSSGSEQERGMQSKVFEETEFPNDMDFGNLSVAPMDPKGFSSDDFGEDLFGDSSSRSASVAFRESSEFKGTNKEAILDDKSTFDDDEAFFEQHNDSKPFDFDFQSDAANDEFPDDGGKNDEKQESKRSGSLLGDQTKAKKSTEEVKVNLGADSFAEESLIHSNSQSRSARGTSSRHSKGFQSGHSRNSRSERSRQSRRRNSQRTAGSSKDSSYGSFSESISIASKESKQSRNSSKSSTLSSKKNRPSISEYLPKSAIQSRSGSKSIDSRSETEPSLALVDVFGASALGPPISEEASSTNDDNSDRSKESKHSHHGTSSRQEIQSYPIVEEEGEVQNSAHNRSVGGLASLASDQPSMRQRFRSSLKNADNSGTTCDQGKHPVESDTARSVTFSERSQNREDPLFDSDLFGGTVTEDSEQSKRRSPDSFTHDLMSPPGKTRLSSIDHKLYELTEKTESSPSKSYGDGSATRESQSPTPTHASDSSSVKQSMSSACQEIREEFLKSPSHDTQSQFSTHSDTISVPTSSQDLDDHWSSSRSPSSQQSSPSKRDSNNKHHRKNSLHHSNTRESSPTGSSHKYSSQSTTTRSRNRSDSSSVAVPSPRPIHSHGSKSRRDQHREESSDNSTNFRQSSVGSVPEQSLADVRGLNQLSKRSHRKSPSTSTHKEQEESLSSVAAKSFTSDDTSLARSQIYSLKTSSRNESFRNDSNMKSSSFSSFEASFSSRSYESSQRSHDSQSMNDSKKKVQPIPRAASATLDAMQSASQYTGEESSQRVPSRGPEKDNAPKREQHVDREVQDESIGGRNVEMREVVVSTQKRTQTTDCGHDEAGIHDCRTIHSLLFLKALGMPLVAELKEVHVSIHNEGYLHAVEVAYMMLLQLRPRIRYMLSLPEWIHIHILMLYARVYECELAAARIAQSKDFRIQLPDSLRVLEPLSLALASIGIVEDKILGVRYVPVARPLHRKATSDDGLPYPYHPPDPDDVTEFLEWTQYNWNSSWIKVEQAREARKALAVVDGIQLPEKSFPVNHAKLLEWENVALEKWLGWDESLWYSYEQTVRLVERKFHFVDFPSDECTGTYSWLLPLKVVDDTLNTSGIESNATTESWVCRVPHFGIGQAPEVWMLALLFNFCALHENQTATWYYESTPVHDVSSLLSKFMQTAIRS